MALIFKFRQNKDKTKPKAYKKWFARAVHTETVGIRALADVMQENCTVKRSDILAVLSELADSFPFASLTVMFSGLLTLYFLPPPAA